MVAVNFGNPSELKKIGIFQIPFQTFPNSLSGCHAGRSPGGVGDNWDQRHRGNYFQPTRHLSSKSVFL